MFYGVFRKSYRMEYNVNLYGRTKQATDEDVIRPLTLHAGQLM